MEYWGTEHSKRARNLDGIIAKPGWFPDPNEPGALRHWNGNGWSESLFDDV
jgi:hypothetical protein